MQVRDFLTFLCSHLYSAQFVDTMSKALQIPKWRLFNIRTEKGIADECLIVKFGIIGEGIPTHPHSHILYAYFIMLYLFRTV